MQKKIMLFIAAIFAVVCAVFCCQNNKVSNESIVIDTEDYIDKDTELSTDEQIMTGSFSMLKKCKVDTDTGKKMYGDILNGQLEYDSGIMELGSGTIININGLDVTDIPVISMLFVDGLFVPFSIDDSEYKEIHKYSMVCNEEKFINIKFTPTGISNEDSKRMWFVTIPFYDIADSGDYKNIVSSVGVNIKAVESTNCNVENESFGQYELVDKIEEYSSLEDMEIDIVNDVGMYGDCLVQTNLGEVFYVASHGNGKHTTFLFCDGEKYAGFDKTDCLIWESENDEYVIKKLDISELPSGKHVIFTITLDDGNVYKSKNKGVVIDAK